MLLLVDENIVEFQYYSKQIFLLTFEIWMVIFDIRRGKIVLRRGK